MIELRDGEDVLRARLAARELVRQAGLGLTDQTRFAAAVSELGHNALLYGGRGECELSDLSDPGHWRLQACVRDHGPGIADLSGALRDGASTGSSLGVGLCGARRLVDLFEITSGPAGTVVTVQIVAARRP